MYTHNVAQGPSVNNPLFSFRSWTYTSLRFALLPHVSPFKIGMSQHRRFILVIIHSSRRFYSSVVEFAFGCVGIMKKISFADEMKLEINSRSIHEAASRKSTRIMVIGSPTQPFYGHGARKSESITVKCYVVVVG